MSVTVYFVHGAWTAHERAVDHHRQVVAERRLASLVLPPGLSPADPNSGACDPSPDMVCAASAMTPQDVQPIVERVVGGAANNTLCEMIPPPDGQECPVTVYGKIAGYPAAVVVFHHLLIVRQGHPPAGAVPFKPGARHAFYLGSDVTIELITPDS